MINYDKVIQCKFCNQGGLYFDSYTNGQGENKWRVTDENGEVHRCKSDARKSNVTKTVTCNRCDETGLSWRLVDNQGNIHECRTNA